MRGWEAFLARIIATREQPVPDLPVTYDILVGRDTTHTKPVGATVLTLTRQIDLVIEVLPS